MSPPLHFLLFGGSGKVAIHFTQHAVPLKHTVTSIIRSASQIPALEKLGAKPVVLSLEDVSVPDLTDFISETKPDVVIFAAGAGGKGGADRTRKVDYEGALKVFNAMESSGTKRLILVGAVDIRDRQKGYPEWYNEEDSMFLHRFYIEQGELDLELMIRATEAMSDRMWKAIPDYMKAKYDAEVELHHLKQIQFTVIRPGGLTDAAAGGAVMGKTRLQQTSRELVAKTILACAGRPETAGFSIDVMDGEGDVNSELEKVVEQDLDSWVG
ncbi:hypothetical protein P7C73_g299, partial [Tremellales sp. Uapishka_1]